MNSKFDSYSGFMDDGGAKTDLDKVLKAAGIKTLIVYGIATDYCVKATALDGLKEGYKVIVVQDLCRGVADETSKAALEEMRQKGAQIWPSRIWTKSRIFSRLKDGTNLEFKMGEQFADTFLRG